jgi:hypothetical protein
VIAFPHERDRPYLRAEASFEAIRVLAPDLLLALILDIVSQALVPHAGSLQDLILVLHVPAALANPVLASLATLTSFRLLANLRCPHTTGSGGRVREPLPEGSDDVDCSWGDPNKGDRQIAQLLVNPGEDVAPVESIQSISGSWVLDALPLVECQREISHGHLQVANGDASLVHPILSVRRDPHLLHETHPTLRVDLVDEGGLGVADLLSLLDLFEEIFFELRVSNCILDTISDEAGAPEEAQGGRQVSFPCGHLNLQRNLIGGSS